MIILLAGLPGTGKSTLARALAPHLNAVILSKDEIRHAIFPPNDIEYSTRQDDFVMHLMLEAAAWLLKENPTRVIFFDGRTFSRGYQIDEVIKAADQLHQPWRILECVCSEELARNRIDSQSFANEHPAGNRTFALYQEVKSRFEPITHPKAIIDTGLPLEECVAQALAALC
jgi:adenylylsulfate kinase